MRESVAGILKKESLILLGKRKPGGSIGGKWEFPGGKVKHSESHNEALIREYQEELGIIIEVKKYIATANFTHKDEDFKLFAYEISTQDYNFSLREHSEFKWFTIDEIISIGEDLAESDRLLVDKIQISF